MSAHVDEFVEQLVALCNRHKASIFPRRDTSGREFVSVMLGPHATAIWLDFKDINGDGARRATPMEEDQ